nr:glycosyltransferase [Draconibacterium orientale]
MDTLYKLKEHDFIFDVYGLTYDQYITVVDYQKDKLNELKDKVIFHGPIENRIARQKIAQSDYSILFRDINKMTKAGFPTKVVESISCGTPVITNNTSDLQNYIFEGENGFVVDLSKPDLHLHKMNEILKMDTMAINKMKQNCAKSELFSYQNFKDKTERFLQKI